MSVERIDLREWEPRRMAPVSIQDNGASQGTKILVIGPPGAGKSVLIRDVMQVKSDIIPTAVVVTTFPELWTPHLPGSNIFSDLTPQLLSAVKARQMARIASGRGSAWLFLVIETSDKSVLRSPAFRDLVKNGRHYQVLMVVTISYFSDMDACLRQNFDVVVLFREPAVVTRKKYFQRFAPALGTFKVFDYVMQAVTSNFGMLVCDMRQQSDLSGISWYKARINVPSFRYRAVDWTSVKPYSE